MNNKNITIVYGSPRENGNSDKLGKEFVKGVKETSNNINEIYIRNLNINGCLGCEYCYEHNGECAQQDDMQKIYKILEKTDIIVFTTPIYYQSFPSQVKAFIDRLYVTENREFNIKESILLATYASTENESNKFMIEYFKDLSKYQGWKNSKIITVSGLDEKDDILNNKALEEAYNLGKSINE